MPVYQTVMAETGEGERAALRKELESGAIDFVTFTSSSTVENLVKLLGGIEPAIVASTYTIEGLVEAMRESLV